MLAGTPIGASVDASERLGQVLENADVIAAEELHSDEIPERVP